MTGLTEQVLEQARVLLQSVGQIAPNAPEGRSAFAGRPDHRWGHFHRAPVATGAPVFATNLHS